MSNSDEVHDRDPDLTDGRAPGDWRTRYDKVAWIQIIGELIYLVLLLSAMTVALVFIGIALSQEEVNKGMILIFPYDLHSNRDLLKWFAVALAGIVGGITFDMKWLYHSVARRSWNQDRILWRILVPFVSGVVSLFFAFMIVSGIIPFLNIQSFNSIYFGIGFGFLFGYFSDNVIAGLYNLANRVFGLTD